MANIIPANFAFKDPSGDLARILTLSDADITLLNAALQDIEDLKLSVGTAEEIKNAIYKTGDVKITLNLTENLEEGWLLMNGALVSRTTYKDLWEFANDNNLVRETEAIADLSASEDLAFGPGDGSTTFSIPNMSGRYIIGASSGDLGKYVKEQLPNITGYIRHYAHGNQVASSGDGAFTYTGSPYRGNGTGSGNCDIVSFDAAKSNSMYVDSGRIAPLSLSMNYCIKI